MKLASMNLSRQININENTIPIIKIENKRLFRNVILDIYEQIEGKNGELILSDNNKEIKFSKNVEIVNDYININLNDKRILNKLYNVLKIKTLEEYDNYSKISEIITEYIQELLYDEELDLVQINNIDPVDIFKSVSINIDDSSKCVIEKFLDYINLSETFMNTKLFVFINFKDFFTDEEIIQIYNRLILNKT
ncbi:MAG TPA: type II-A CRISPR-associated protein Csn2, partial [Acholeplasmataceae bacterium]|nr:type II-A CRISPR-associated protein Csn2 [Acholeplasmataceae bacterium]